MKQEVSTQESMDDGFVDLYFDDPLADLPNSNHATVPMYVKSVGRGQRVTPSPLDIPLPPAFSAHRACRQKQVQRQESPQKAVTNSSPKPQKSNRTANTVKDKKISKTDNLYKSRGRGRGRILESSLAATTKPKPVVQIRDLGTAGLPNGESDIQEGKARLMEMFLGKHSHFANEQKLNQEYSSESKYSTKTAPNFNLMDDSEFPQISGVPFKSTGSLDGHRKKKKNKGLSSLAMELSNGTTGSEVTGGPSGVVTTGKGHLSSGDEVDRRLFADGRRASDVRNAEGATCEAIDQGDNGEALQGPNVIELMGLPPTLTHQNLGDLLMGCGTIIDMKILRDPDTKCCIGLAYVRMEESHGCSMAITSFNNIESPFADMYESDTPPVLSVRLMPS